MHSHHIIFSEGKRCIFVQLFPANQWTEFWTNKLIHWTNMRPFPGEMGCDIIKLVRTCRYNFNHQKLKWQKIENVKSWKCQKIEMSKCEMSKCVNVWMCKMCYLVQVDGILAWDDVFDRRSSLLFACHSRKSARGRVKIRFIQRG